MLLEFRPDQAEMIAGAMAVIANSNRNLGLTGADKASVAGAYHYLLRQSGPLDFAALPAPSPGQLAEILTSGDLAREAAHMLTVMAFVDGSIDAEKIEAVLQYAAALGIDEPYIKEIEQAAHGQVQLALADMVRNNMESITGRVFLPEDVMSWLLPYGDGKDDPALAARYHALADLPEGSFGRIFWEMYRQNDYRFPGEPEALNEAFAQPHDSVHILAGYDTSARGELLVSTFTAASHPSRPMEGHILPVIFSWHLGVKINDVAKSATGALDPTEFWHAWARGAATKTDVFAPGWDFWDAAPRPLAEVRAAYGVPADAPSI